MSLVAALEPKALWQHFDRILTIPRGSKEEDRIRAYVIEVAKKNGLSHDVDAAGNVVVRKPASKGKEKSPAVILQGHLDMVNEKNSDVVHDFDKDPLIPRREGEYLMATGTTLGSDNGIGVAAMLAIMEAKGLTHGPLEFLFTMDEETGLTGATNLDPKLLSGRILLNLDSEEEYTLTVGCAGGANTSLHLPLKSEAKPAGKTVGVRLRGMHGGHSGIDIHLQRGNAVKLLGRLLNAARVKTSLRLARLEGGNKHNAIPREASAAVHVTDVNAFKSALLDEFKGIKVEYAVAEPELAMDISDDAGADRVWTEATTNTVIGLLEALPHGVLAMSLDIKGLVETSTNVAVVSVKDNELTVLSSSRSSVMSALRATQRRLRAIGELVGARVEESDGYPGWKPDMSSKLLGVVNEIHKKVQGREAEVVAVHAGLECGIIGEKIPGMDMISFGPQIEHPHSPNERVQIPSVERFYKLLTAVLERLAA